MRISQYHYIDFEYPLVDLNMTRKDCLQWMKDNGYPQPPRSACTFCPYHSNAEWLRIKNETPDEWAEVVALDKQLRTGFVGTNKMKITITFTDQVNLLMKLILKVKKIKNNLTLSLVWIMNAKGCVEYDN